ncbi:hypothetical protein LAZ67_7002485 [Cordylochernes scorpioides]|uniref:Transposase n=1 Tax=Cordylochernes scorpioides TaxID=51811 RepID=A0ABY6KRU8_9ARAC|nr:hypothetical protein LAZ67_7002485 [Cordylochernes scorpioides]
MYFDIWLLSSQEPRRKWVVVKEVLLVPGGTVRLKGELRKRQEDLKSRPTPEPIPPTATVAQLAGPIRELTVPRIKEMAYLPSYKPFIPLTITSPTCKYPHSTLTTRTSAPFTNLHQGPDHDHINQFKAGRISIEDDPRQGRPKFQRTDENVQKITDLIKENPRTTLLELEQDTGISKTTIGRIVTEDLRLKKTPAKFIPRFLTNEQKLCQLATCEDMLEMTRTDPEWKDKIITGDETWVYGYDPETKRQSAEWRGQAFFRCLREAIRKKRPEKWTNGDWILHHDNARPHTAHLVTSFLAKNGTEILPQPPYSPDIAPNDFFLFPKLKAVLKGRHFDTREDIIEKSLLALKSIPKEAYKNCFDNWEKRWRWCVEARGDYFEKFNKKN